ncbi:MAG: T9SS type A sorting domain-containing protein [Candidatus Krumholzibacteriia bacterium]
MIRNRCASILAAKVLAFSLSLAPGGAVATTETAVLFSSDAAAGDDFGWSLAVEGTTLVVGAPNADVAGNSSQGAVYVFEDQVGSWVQIQKLTASDGAAFDQFGFAVAVSGDLMVIGAEEAPIGPNSSQGAAYVFERTGGIWTEIHKLEEPSTIENFAEYGHSVDIEGETVVIGGSKAGPVAHGRVYVYGRNEGGADAWGLVAELQDDINDSNAGFGESVDLEGDHLVVGALLLDRVQGTYNNEGGAYVFTRDGSGVWSQSAKLFGSDAAGNDRGGIDVAMDGMKVVVGAYSYENGGYGRGAAYLFDNPTQTPGGWVETAILTPGDPEDFGYFGHAVAVLGNDVWVGAEGHTSGAGKAYRFNVDQGGPGSWGEAEQYVSGSPAANDLLAYAMAVDSGTVALGAFAMDVGGAVLVYPAPGGGASPVPGDRAPGASAGRLAAYPNPFNPVTTFAFTVDRRGEVEVLVHDLRGALVARVFRGELGSGEHQVTWSADGVPSGLYLATVRAGREFRTTTVNLVK